MTKNPRVLIFLGDIGGCYEYRVRIPFSELKRYGVTMVPLPELPNDPFSGNDFGAILQLIQQYDLVILQRCFRIEIAMPIKAACEILGKKMIFETDDDYLNLPPHNPCYPEVSSPKMRSNFARIIEMADAVTVSTSELAKTLRQFNPNIHIFPNNVEHVYCGDYLPPVRGYTQEQMDGDGNTKIPSMHGMIAMPAFFRDPGNKKRINRTIRIGYSATPSHREDFKTVKYALDKIMRKYHGRIWLFFIGDKWFGEQMLEGGGRIITVPPQSYQMYMYQLRNLDIGIAPLVPDLFNMSKSSIKAVEYATWGVPAVLPHYVTYTRDFTPGVNCLTYYNQGEFQESLEELINNHELREGLGENARNYVVNNRLERLHTQGRFELYSQIAREQKFKQFQPLGSLEPLGAERGEPANATL